ncbi:MAG: KAP family NTPase [Paenibacillus sp.]|nr:KAP family NTPase [Paenibacillus sp.]
MEYCIAKVYRSWRFWIEVYLAVMAVIFSQELADWISRGLSGISAIFVDAPTFQAAKLVTAFALTACMAGICYRRWRSCVFSPYMVMWTVVVMVYACRLTLGGITAIGHLAYSHIIVTGCVIVLIIEALKLIREDKEHGDTTDSFITSISERYPDGREEFARSLANRIKSTSGKDAFAVAITGTWGAGKTSFLEYVDRNIDADGDIKIWFCPWNSNSADNIISDFFDVLSDHIRPFNGSMRSEMLRYASVLISSGINENMSRVAGIFQTLMQTPASIDSIKSRIEEGLNHLPGRVYIFIDDMDRLDKDEILQVLKLIRNTANFSRITYIVSFDREYVISTIDNNGVGRAHDFIEKIFNIEIALPHIEEHAIPRMVWSMISPLLADDDGKRRILVNELLKKDNPGGYLFPRYVSNYRKALRFVNMFSNHIAFLKGAGRLDILDFREFFWVEVMRYAYPEQYNQLASDRDSLLELKSKDGTYSMKAGTIVERDDKLKWLFSELFMSIPSSCSISHPHNFGHYFALRVYDNHLSTSEFSQLVMSGNAIEDTVDMWVKQRPSLHDSLLFNLRNFDLSGLSPQMLENYLTILRIWTEKSMSKDAVKLYHEIFDCRRTYMWSNSNIRKLLRKSLLNMRNDMEFLPLKLDILHELRPVYDNSYNTYVDQYCIPEDTFRELMSEILTHLDAHGLVTPEEMFNTSGLLHKLVKKSGIIIGTETDTFTNIHDQLIWPQVFNLLKTKPRGKNLEKFLEERMVNYTVSSDDDELDFEYEAYFDYIDSMYGSNTSYKTFCMECFEGTEEEKEALWQKYATP